MKPFPTTQETTDKLVTEVFAELKDYPIAVNNGDGFLKLIDKLGVVNLNEEQTIKFNSYIDKRINGLESLKVGMES